ncbi:hypothetical protein KDW_51990 [Dictyobacter vulcani]|uniref:Methyltransferase type 11 domain-containing protein n=1 Tax=Dictyobacter vulcani TaxID=2607529 RepID=A0A5J4KWY1_9CHLR|nr:class I SAM-dependent methyltransferase [Dictyobacter vulcani]GER91037.1 hypothetical protein KDW_51990 [Dictyobacter vulcani]
MPALYKFIEDVFGVGESYGHPAGWKGMIAGKLMAKQHYPENQWTVELLQLQGNEQVLEVGFGPGIAIQAAAALLTTGKITGVDISKAMMREARRRNAQAVRVGRVELLPGNAYALPFADSTFDKIYSIHVIYVWWWNQPQQVLAEVYRVLKPGGLFCVTFLSRESWPGYSAEKAASFDGPDGPSVEKLFTEAGFRTVHINNGPVAKKFREIAVLGIK